jgi:hypothetical protein
MRRDFDDYRTIVVRSVSPSKAQGGLGNKRANLNGIAARRDFASKSTQYPVELWVLSL